jgi:glycosyltransferase involved in cell wall biosynthesis
VDVSFLSAGHVLSDARLHRLASALVRSGLSVEVLGMGDVRDAPPGVEAQTYGRPSLRRRAALAPVLPWRARGDVLVAFEPATSVATVPVARLRGKRVVVDVYEDYLALLHDRAWATGPSAAMARAVARAAVAAAGHADLTTVADEQVAPFSARHRLVVRNLPDPSMLPESTVRDAESRAVYVGDVRRSRGLFTMLKALEAAPRWSLDVVGLVAAADEHGVADWLIGHPETAARVRFLGRHPPATAWEPARGAWAGLALLDGTPAFSEAMPSKLYEYVACGLPVVATALPRQRDFVARHRCGALVPIGEGAASATGAALEHWLDNPSEYERVANGAAAAGAQYRRANNYRPFVRAVQDLLPA